MTDSYRAELREIIDRAFVAEYGSRATSQMVHHSVARDLPQHLLDYLIGKGIKAEIGSYFRAKGGDGLPLRPKVTPDGEHADMSLLSQAEMAYPYGQYLDAADANATQAEKVRVRCLKRYGVDLAGVAA